MSEIPRKLYQEKLKAGIRNDIYLVNVEGEKTPLLFINKNLNWLSPETRIFIETIRNKAMECEIHTDDARDGAFALPIDDLANSLTMLEEELGVTREENGKQFTLKELSQLKLTKQQKIIGL